MIHFKPILAAIVVSILVATSVFGQSSSDRAAKTNKALIKKIFDELINKKDLTTLDRHVAKDAIDHSAWPGQAPGREGLRGAVAGLHDAYPDIKVDVKQIIAEGDFVSTREEWTATEKATGKKRSGWVMHIFKIKDGVIAEEWSKGWEWLSDAP